MAFQSNITTWDEIKLLAANMRGEYWSTIWDDINLEVETITISPTDYSSTSLGNTIYKIIDDRVARREVLKNNKIRGTYNDLDKIRQHRDNIETDGTVNGVISALFKIDALPSITPLDRVYINSYYRRLLRAKLERDYLDRDLTPGLVVTNYNNAETDASLVKTMRVLRIVCKFLGIRSTSEAATFPPEKLSVSDFWTSVFEKFVELFGEERIEEIPEEDDELYVYKVLLLLNIIFNTWSGSALIVNDDKMIEVIPATYVMRLLTKLK